MVSKLVGLTLVSVRMLHCFSVDFNVNFEIVLKTISLCISW
jgi:hypothetical protein